MKLSNAQQKVLDDAKKKIDIARRLDYPTWLEEREHVPRHRLQEAIARDYLKSYWEAERRGEALMYCNSKTLRKLAEYGLIEIIEDSTGQTYGLDVIKILNY